MCLQKALLALVRSMVNRTNASHGAIRPSTLGESQVSSTAYKYSDTFSLANHKQQLRTCPYILLHRSAHTSDKLYFDCTGSSSRAADRYSTLCPMGGRHKRHWQQIARRNGVCEGGRPGSEPARHGKPPRGMFCFAHSLSSLSLRSRSCQPLGGWLASHFERWCTTLYRSYQIFVHALDTARQLTRASLQNQATSA